MERLQKYTHPPRSWLHEDNSSLHVQAELKVLMDLTSPSFSFARDLLRHNLVIFRGGEGALQVFPPLLGVVTEARLNLAIYYLKQGMSQCYLCHLVLPVSSSVTVSFSVTCVTYGR